MSILTSVPANALPVPKAAEVKRYLYENAILGETTRYRQLDRYEAHYACRQYSHLQFDWWGMNADSSETISPEILVPYGYSQPAMAMNVRQKRPTAPYNLAKAIVDRFTGLLFSDNRKPTVNVEGDPDTEDFLRAATDQMRFWAKLREARALGGAMGTAMVTIHVKGGKFMMEAHNPKHCQIVWLDRRAFKVKALLICYRYPREEDVVDEKTGEVKGTKVVDYLYRRIVTDEDDTVYKQVKLELGADLKWEVESEVVHGLGFFPGVWVQNLPVLAKEDGEPDCQGAWQNFDTMDRLLAQMNKAVLLNLDPTVVISVDPKVVDSQGGVRKGSDNALMVGTGGSASYMEITGGGVTTGMSMLANLKQNTLDIVRCVMVDPEKISGSAQSAKAIEYIYAPMLEKADDLRAQWGDLCVIPLLEVIEKIARHYSGDKDLGPNQIGRYEFKLPPKKDEQTGKLIPRHLGEGGYIGITWGPYFAPTESDKETAIRNIVAAKTGGILDTESAVRKAAVILEISDPNQVLKRLKEDEDKQMQQGMGGGMGLGFGETATPTDEEPPPPAPDEGA